MHFWLNNLWLKYVKLSINADFKKMYFIKKRGTIYSFEYSKRSSYWRLVKIYQR